MPNVDRPEGSAVPVRIMMDREPCTTPEPDPEDPDPDPNPGAPGPDPDPPRFEVEGVVGLGGGPNGICMWLASGPTLCWGSNTNANLGWGVEREVQSGPEVIWTR
jgi:hypothetical protein